MVQACRCGCVDFARNLFKPEACTNCLHVHTKRGSELPTLPTRPEPPEVLMQSIPKEPPASCNESSTKPKGFHRANIVAEILETEKSFIYQLGMLQSYQKLLARSGVISTALQEKLFSGIGAIIELHKSFLVELQERIDASKPYDTIPLGDLFCQFCPFLKAHIAYATKHDEGEQVVKQLGDSNKKFVEVLNEFPVEAYKGVFGLTSLRIAPVQRIPRYKLLLHDLMEHTPKDSADYDNLQQAYEKFAELGSQINTNLHVYQGSVLIQKLDSRLSGNREDLASSGAHSIYQHHTWSSRKRAPIPVVCQWCKILIFPGKRFQNCKSCDATVHARGCVDAISPLCTEPSLMEQGRKFLQEFPVKYQNAAKSRKPKPATLVLFNDSLFFYYGSAKEAQMAAMIRWKSSTTGKSIVIVDSGQCTIAVTAPRTFEQHYIQAASEEDKEFIYRSINNAIKAWNAEQEKFHSQNRAIRSDSTTLVVSEDDINPRVQFHISTTQDIYSNGDIYTGYVIEVVEPKQTTVILKRYEEFVGLHTNLRGCFGSRKLPKLPSKHRLKDTKNKVMYKQLRCRGLEQYLNGIVEVKGLIKLPVFHEFVRTSLVNAERPNDESTWKDDELSDDSWDEISDEFTDENEQAAMGQILFDFNPLTASQKLKGEPESHGLAVLAGDAVFVLNEDNNEWFYCRNRAGSTGFVPSSYVSKFHDTIGIES